MKTLLLSLALLAGLNTNAYAQSVCIPSAKIAELAKRMKARPIFTGEHKASKNRYLVFVSEETGLWSAFKTVGEMTCLLVEGEGFALAVEPKK